MAAEKLPVNPLQPKMEVVILPDHVLEMVPLVLKGAGLNELYKMHGMSRSGMKARLRKIYHAFDVKSRWELYMKAATEGLHYRGESSSAVVYYAETVIREKSL